MTLLPLEPFPAPPIQAIGPDGLEYPPRVPAASETFEEMVRRFNLIQHARKRRRLGIFDSSRTDGPSNALFAEDLALSLQSVEEAMRDLLIAVDLTHVARGQGQFIGYDSLAAHDVDGHIPASYIPGEVVLGMKKDSLVKAAADMKSWINKTRGSLHKGRQFIQEIRGLRRTSRLRVSGGRSGAMSRPLLPADTLSLFYKTVGGQALVPFELDQGGRPTVPARHPLERDVMAFKIIHGPTRTSASSVCTLGEELLLLQGEHAHLSVSVRGLETEAYKGLVLDALMREVSGAGMRWTDRHGIGLKISPQEEEQSSALSGRQQQQQLGTVSRPAKGNPDKPVVQVVHCDEHRLLVELDYVHVIEIGQGRVALRDVGDDDVDGGLKAQLKGLSKWAMLRTLELALTKKEGGLLCDVSRFLAHRQHVEGVSRSLQRLLAAHTEVLQYEAMWIEYPLERPRSRLALVAGMSCTIDIIMEDTQISITYTKNTSDGKTNSASLVSLSELDDIERYLANILTSVQ